MGVHNRRRILGLEEFIQVSVLFISEFRLPPHHLVIFVAYRYFRKFESFRSHPDYPLVDKNVRGRVGPVQVGFFNTMTLWCNAFVKSSIATGIPLTHDFNGADLNPIGVGRVCIHPPVILNLLINVICVA